MKPLNFEEKLVWYYLLGTYVWYFLGLQFVLGPLLAWFLTLYLCKKLWNQTEDTPLEEKVCIPASIWVWIASMLLMEFALIMGHIDFDLGLPKIITSSIQWAKSWALLALFPLIGCLNIRPKLIYRAVCIFCLQSLVVIIVGYLLYALGIPTIGYLSPVWLIMRGAQAPYSVGLFEIDLNDAIQLRLTLFTPFANTLGIVASVYFFLASQEADKKWRLIGMIVAAAMVVGSVSRMTTLCLIIVPIVTWILTSFSWPLQLAAGGLSLVVGMFASPLIEFVKDIWNQTFNGYRSGSKLVRDRLKQIALERSKDAPLWGHGVVLGEGPKVTEHMPIGSHEQWSDLMYVKGIVGFIAFLIPLLWTFIILLFKAQNNKTAKVGLSIFLLFVICSFGADLEAASYLYWPGLVVVGSAFKEQAFTRITDNNNYALPYQ